MSGLLQALVNFVGWWLSYVGLAAGLVMFSWLLARSCMGGFWHSYVWVAAGMLISGLLLAWLCLVGWLYGYV